MKEMNNLISRKDAVSAISDLLISRFVEKVLPTWNDVYNAINDIPSAEPEERTAKVENKWHWNCDPYDESTSPTEAGYYRIIDEDGTEMTDYFFGEPRITGRGIGYWATCEKTILAWSRLEVTDERTTD